MLRSKQLKLTGSEQTKFDDALSLLQFCVQSEQDQLKDRAE
jgi:hypothetical protein